MSVVARLAPALALASVLACATGGGLHPLTVALPTSLPPAAVRAGWERIAGDYETPSEHVRYALFVDPGQPFLFRITQYRVSPWGTGPDGRRRLEEGAETVIWNQTPGTRSPLLCFAQDPPGRAATTSPPASASWRDVSPSTFEFRDSMRRAIEIYAIVHREGRAGPPVH
jgi:hypothetical protein